MSKLRGGVRWLERGSKNNVRPAATPRLTTLLKVLQRKMGNVGGGGSRATPLLHLSFGLSLIGKDCGLLLSKHQGCFVAV